MDNVYIYIFVFKTSLQTDCPGLVVVVFFSGLVNSALWCWCSGVEPSNNIYSSYRFKVLRVFSVANKYCIEYLKSPTFLMFTMPIVCNTGISYYP